MTWSYSRVRAFFDCPYKWYLRYIRGLSGRELFFAAYGTFMHRMIELYLRGEKTKDQLINMYLCDFRREVTGATPNSSVFSNYFHDGLRYLRELKPFPFNVVAVERRVDFSIDGVPLVGYIDILGERDGELYIIDNKSRTLKPRSKRGRTTKTDEELDSYLKQLYLYSMAVEQEYGRPPAALCFNCYRVPLFIEEPFSREACDKSKRWFLESVGRIAEETEFSPDAEFFKCRYLCEMQDHCEYYKLTGKR